MLIYSIKKIMWKLTGICFTFKDDILYKINVFIVLEYNYKVCNMTIPLFFLSVYLNTVLVYSDVKPGQVRTAGTEPSWQLLCIVALYLFLLSN